MQYFPNQLKEKLVKALDKDNNVVDMPGVLEVIFLLEKCTLTREDLEQTRIGKIVNELRKKTSNRDVAKRAKNLVKRWQALISAPPTVNGDGITVRGGLGSKPASPALSRLSPASTGSSKPASPALQRLSPKTIAGLSPKLPLACQKVSGHKQYTASNGRTSVSPVSQSVSATCITAGQTCLHSAGHPGSTSTSPRLNSNHVSHGPNYVYHHNKNSQSGHSHTPGRNFTSSKTEAHKTSPDTCAAQTLSKTNAANKKRRRTPDPNSPNEIPSKKQLLQPEDRCVDQNGTKSHVLKDNGTFSGFAKLKRTSSAPDMVNGVALDKHAGDSGRAVDAASLHDGNKDWAHHHRRLDSPVLKPPLGGATTSPGTPVSKYADEAQSSFAAKRNVNLLLQTPDQPSERPDKSGSASKTPKVKTTAQLIAELQAKQGVSSFGSATISKITKNQIEKEPDDILQSVVPASAKPRPRRKPGSDFLPPSTPTGSLSQTKTEMVRKFLQTSITPTSSDADLSSPFRMDHHRPHHLLKSETISSTAAAADNTESLSDVEIDVEAIDTPAGERGLVAPSSWQAASTSYASAAAATARLGHQQHAPHTNMKLADIYSLLPPLNLEEINLDEDDTHSETVPVDVTQESLDRLEKEKWEGVNGNFTEEKQWNELTDTFPGTTYDGQPLFILPYVNIDD